MEALQWNEVLATGIEEIDDQHKRLLEILNQLRVAAERRERKEATAEVLQQMLDYTIYHFDYEEKLLEHAGYELLPLHKRTHELFIRRIPDFQKRHAAGEEAELLPAARRLLDAQQLRELGSRFERMQAD